MMVRTSLEAENGRQLFIELTDADVERHYVLQGKPEVWEKMSLAHRYAVTAAMADLMVLDLAEKDGILSEDYVRGRKAAIGVRLKKMTGQ